MKLYLALSLTLVAGSALAFWVPAALAAPGWSFAPLDDVFIYFDYARSTARGHPLHWSDGNGYSTGATSPTYALVLAQGYLAGLRGPWIALWAAIVAIVSLVDLSVSLRALAPGPSRVSWLAPLSMLMVPVLDWSWFSGMEAAFFGAVLGRSVLAVARVAESGHDERASAQWGAGAWIAAMALTRPESLPLALALGVASAHASGRLAVLPALLRSAGPTVGALAFMAALAKLCTGEAAAAGAVRKLLTTDPYAAPFDHALRALTHAVRLATEGVEAGVGGRLSLALLSLLALASFAHTRLRRLAIALLVGALGAFALVTLNGTAPFQNFRYLVPTFACLLVAAQLGLYALEGLGRTWLAAGVSAQLVVAALALGDLPRQIDHFARSSKNIAEQQVAVGHLLAAMSPRPRRVFVNDAGAIPYVSDLPALDGLGLGGYHDYPFARASVHGWPAVVELVERMPEHERPDVLAIYDSWWPGLAARFGTRLHAVRVDDNLILGHPEKAIYRADWSLLHRPRSVPPSIDRIDVADLVDEREHALWFTRPRGGYVVEATLEDESGARRWEAGRVLAEGQRFGFELRGRFAGTSAKLRLRTDTPEARVELRLRTEAPILLAASTEPEPGRWSELSAELGYVTPGDALELVVTRGSLRAYVVELVESELAAARARPTSP